MQQRAPHPSTAKREPPRPPFPKQHQDAPGLESDLEPAPRYLAPEYKAAGKLQGKVALVTGGDSGIGRAVAVLYAREGAHVALSYLEVEQPDADLTRKEIEKHGVRCATYPGDLTDPGFCDDLVARTVREFGRIDILVSNAAHQERKADLESLSDADIALTFDTNVFAFMRLTRAALRHMQPGSAIIITSSETGLLGSARLPDYSATKGALNALTKTLGQALIERNIRVNAVAPGPVWTPLNPSDAGLPPERVARFGESNPMGRPAQPEEVAPAYVFLASNADSSYITGIVLPVMGGQT
jgi:NAD(P)-dependent dehydrogenase (short-subunit alcohol dehydrogenase family)